MRIIMESEPRHCIFCPLPIGTWTRPSLSQTGAGPWFQISRHFWPKMAPKSHRRGAAKAKAAAKAASARKVAHRRERRAALCDLNALADEVGAGAVQLDTRTCAPADVERAIYIVQARCQEAALAQRLRLAVQRWVDNGGKLEAQLAPAVDLESPSTVPKHKVLLPEFELRSKAFMLTYNSRSLKRESWPAFRDFISTLKGRIGARAWAANLEESLHAAVANDVQTLVFHCHAYYIWTDGVGIFRRSLSEFCFEGIRPRVDTCSVPGGKHLSPHSAACHGLWYVSVMKLGTVFTDTNYAAGVWYKPSPRWLEGLLQGGRLTAERYLELSATWFPVGHSARKRDVDEVLRERREVAARALVTVSLRPRRKWTLSCPIFWRAPCMTAHVTSTTWDGTPCMAPRKNTFFVRARKLHQVAAEKGSLEQDAALQQVPLEPYPEALTFTTFFERPAHRRPILLIVGASFLGKSLLAAQVLQHIAASLHLEGFVEVTVEDDGHLDCSRFDVTKHSGILLDGIGDIMLLKRHRESLQGRPQLLWGARSQTTRYAYPYTLCRRAVVATADLGAENLHLLTTDHWLSKPTNVLVLRLTAPTTAQLLGGLPAALPRTEQMRRWTVAEVVSFLHSHDLEGPAEALFSNGVRGEDFLTMPVEVFVHEFRLSQFAARRIAAARESFLREAL